MSGSLSGKVAIVTGGSRGIGRAIAVALGRQGASVLVNYHSNAGHAEDTVREIVAAGGRAASARADIADADSAKEIFASAEAAFGGIDILVCNAGVAAVMPLTAI